MKRTYNQLVTIVGRPLRTRVRWILLLLIVPLGLSFLFPLWRIRMEAPQYPKGIYIDIYGYKLDGGNEGRDVNEFNALNHYIGMEKLERARIPELGWIPFAFGILALLTLRVAALGNLRDLIDLSVLTAYVTLFFFARYVLMLYQYGHNLAPTAALKLPPFMPVILGTKQIANFTTQSYPLLGTALAGTFAGGLVLLTAWQGLREWRKPEG
ncbi:hypothetical protein FJ251_07230 [bacterium]|nr:hypothetical protein [bacterium]